MHNRSPKYTLPTQYRERANGEFKINVHKSVIVINKLDILLPFRFAKIRILLEIAGVARNKYVNKIEKVPPPLAPVSLRNKL